MTWLLSRLKPIVVILAVVILGGAAKNSFAQSGADYCRYAERSVVLVFDRTSPIDQRDRETIEASITTIDRNLVGRTFFSLQTIGEGVTEGRTIFERCIPGCPPSSARDLFVGTNCVPARAEADRAAFKREFYQKLRELLDRPETTSRSDIADRLREITQTFNTSTRPLSQLIIFSDMIDNVLVPHRLIYTQPADRTLNIARQRNIIGNFTNTNVAIFGFGRSDIPPRGSLSPDQAQVLRTFWTEWFRAGGANVVSLGFRLQPFQ